MESEELRLLRENNYLLKQIFNYLQLIDGKEFLINVVDARKNESLARAGDFCFIWGWENIVYFKYEGTKYYIC